MMGGEKEDSRVGKKVEDNGGGKGIISVLERGII
jgi:hypothetical protein